MNPVFVGRFTRRLDRRRQLRLPVHWRSGVLQSWLLFPHELLGNDSADFRDLRFEPVHGHTPARILETLNVPTKRQPTIDVAIVALRAVAQVRGVDPLVVSQHQTDARSIHIKLSEAQLAWLGVTDQALVLTGVVSAIQIWGTEEFIRWERSVTSEPFADLVNRTLHGP